MHSKYAGYYPVLTPDYRIPTNEIGLSENRRIKGKLRSNNG